MVTCQSFLLDASKHENAIKLDYKLASVLSRITAASISFFCKIAASI